MVVFYLSKRSVNFLSPTVFWSAGQEPRVLNWNVNALPVLGVFGALKLAEMRHKCERGNAQLAF